jgi:hypothetical protein
VTVVMVVMKEVVEEASPPSRVCAREVVVVVLVLEVEVVGVRPRHLRLAFARGRWWRWRWRWRWWCRWWCRWWLWVMVEVVAAGHLDGGNYGS